jgi:hypothetical protein
MANGAYCTGAAGIRALEASREFQRAADGITDEDRTRVELQRGSSSSGGATRAGSSGGGYRPESTLYGVDAATGRPSRLGAGDDPRARIAAERVAAAEAAAADAEAAAAAGVGVGAGSKRKRAEAAAVAAAAAARPVTDADVEEYHRTRSRVGDPMSDPALWGGSRGAEEGE